MLIKFLFITAVVVGVVIYGFIKLLKLQKQRAGNSWLIGKGIKLVVNLEDCELLSRKDTFQQDEGDDFPGTRVKDNPGPPKVYVKSQIRYKHKQSDGKYFDYASPVLCLEEEIIRLRMMQKKTTTIYIDPSNKHNYYFDLSFLR